MIRTTGVIDIVDRHAVCCPRVPEAAAQGTHQHRRTRRKLESCAKRHTGYDIRITHASDIAGAVKDEHVYLCVSVTSMTSGDRLDRVLSLLLPDTL